MKKYAWLLITLALQLLATSVYATAQHQRQGLISISLPAEAPLHWQPEGVEVYARLDGRSGPYLIAGADEKTRAALSRGSIEVQLLDADTAGATYFWAAPTRGRAVTHWEEYGRVLLFDGDQYLLRTTPQEANRLAEIGVEIAQLFLVPQVLPTAPATIPADVDHDPIIQTIVDQVTSPTVTQYTGSLSGEWPVTIGGEPYTIATRYTYSGVPIQKATQYVGEHLAQLGLSVEYHNWSSANYPNVIAELPGQTNPEQIVIICAHLDDVPAGALAPGADDNASGSTGVLLAADILSRYEWDVTLRFALWTGEEQGLYGSAAYALRSFNANEQIIGVLNMDMIAYDSDSFPIFDLHAKSTLPDSVNLANLFADVVGEYALDLQPDVLINNYLGNYSDNASFWARGYTAILAIEDNDDFTPHYHTTGDTLSTLNLAYFTEMVKASVATFAHLGGTPWWGTVQGQVTAELPSNPLPGADIHFISDQHAYSFTTGDNGRYSAPLPAGVYTLTVTAAGYEPVILSGIQVNDDATVTQNVTLGDPPPLAGVYGFVKDVDTQAPIAQAEITFWQGITATTVITSDLTGYYTTTLPAGVYTITATAVGYHPITLSNIELGEGALLRQDIDLEAVVFFGSLAGVITDASTQDAIPNAVITLWQTITPTAVLTTNLSGYYTTTQPAGVYTLTVSAPGYHTVPATQVTIMANAVTSQDFALEPIRYAIYLPVALAAPTAQPENRAASLQIVSFRN